MEDEKEAHSSDADKRDQARASGTGREPVKKDPRLPDPVAAAQAEIDRHRAKKYSGGMKQVGRPKPDLPTPAVPPAHGAQKPGTRAKPTRKKKGQAKD